MLLPLPAWLGLPLLWNKFPSSRLLYPAGLLLLWLALLILPWARFRCSLPRLFGFGALIAAAWWPTRIPASWYWLREGLYRDVLRIEWRDHANSDLFPAFLVAGIAAAAWLARRPAATWLGPAGLLAVAALSNTFFFGDFNPWMSAKPIFARPETAHVAQLRAQAQAHPRGWLVVGGREHLGRILNGWGFRSASHGFIVPETKVLRQIFPRMSERAFNLAFNRYRLVQVGLFLPGGRERLREPLFLGADLTLVPADAFLPETPIELRQGPPAAPLPRSGELREARLEGNRLALSLLRRNRRHQRSNRGADPPGPSRQKIVDRWLRPAATISTSTPAGVSTRASTSKSSSHRRPPPRRARHLHRNPRPRLRRLRHRPGGRDAVPVPLKEGGGGEA